MMLRRELSSLAAAAVASLLAAVAGTPWCSGGEKPPDAVQVTVPLLPETIPGAVADPQQTAVVVTCGKVPAAPAVVLPPVADTHLWKESETPAGNGATVVLRDNRWSQGLFRIDPSGLPSDAVQRAVFRFKAGGSERPGNARLQFHRMLVDWSENATWSKPFPDRRETWNGLRPGQDYETQPFAMFALDAVEAGRHDRGAGLRKGGPGVAQPHLAQLWIPCSLLGQVVADRHSLARGETAGGPCGHDARGAAEPNGRPAPRHGAAGPLASASQDLLAASLRIQIHLKDRPKPPAGARLDFYRQPGKADFETTPFLSVPVAKAGKDGQVLLPGLEKLLRSAGDSPELPLLLAAGGTGSVTLQVFGTTGGKAREPALEATLKAYPRAVLGVRPPAAARRVLHGERQPPRLRRPAAAAVGHRRLRCGRAKRKMGFNCSRLWDTPELYDKQSVKRGEPKAAADHGRVHAPEPDKFDIELAATRKLGMFVMYAGLTSTIPLDKYRESLLADDSFLAGGDDWPAWKAAVAGSIDQNRLTVFDERLARLRFAHARNLLNHRNPLTGKRLGEEEAIVVYEVWNELGFLSWALEGGLNKSPPYFRDKARARWNAWLVRQYADEAALRKAWGRLEPGESLASISPLPAVLGKKERGRG